ncbi:hypothetical protein ACQUD9_07600 [Vagococcus fluvialis]|uniref:hypothetical protein n=1 Tax=Vagococcus fluvialis TaxID=2738 RepID=UPI003D1399CC
MFIIRNELIVIIGATLLLSSCAKNSSKEIPTSYSTGNQESYKIEEASSSDLEGIPNKRIVSEISGKEIDDLHSFDKLTDKEKNELIYEYLLKAMLPVSESQEKLEELLQSKDYTKSDTINLVNVFSKERENNQEMTLNELLIKVVEVIFNEINI